MKLSVLLPLPLNDPFDYTHPHILPFGTLVKVPFGSRERYGIIWESQDEQAAVPKTLKPILQVFEDVQFSELSLKFLKWVSEYTMAPRGQILKMMLPTPEAFEAKGENLYGFAKLPERLTPQRQKVIDFFKASPEPCALNTLSEKSGVSRTILNGLLKEGVLSLQGEKSWAPPPPPSPE